MNVEPVLKRAAHFINWLAERAEEDYMELRRSESKGRLVGTEDFVKGFEQLLGRPIARRAPGRKPTRDASRHKVWDNSRTRFVLAATIC